MRARNKAVGVTKVASVLSPHAAADGGGDGDQDDDED